MKKIVMLILFVFFMASSGCANIQATQTDPWDELEHTEGEVVWDTLTEEQQDIVDYPKFDENNVYWVPNGHSYHAVDWCYTLSNSNIIENGTLDEAIAHGKTDPCSKCVGH